MFNTLGVVSSLDLLGEMDPHLPVTAVMREPLFVPESKTLPELLSTLQAEGRNLALVVDEYGGFVGLVTVEDVVEEIVGEIQDEYDPPQEHVRRVAPGVFVVNARAAVSEVNERFGWNLPQGDYETLGGLVLERLGRVPKPGDGVQAGRRGRARSPPPRGPSRSAARGRRCRRAGGRGWSSPPARPTCRWRRRRRSRPSSWATASSASTTSAWPGSTACSSGASSCGPRR